MTSPLHIFYFIALGSFWGLSAPLYVLMGNDGAPVTHIVVYTGFAVGVALVLIGWVKNRKLHLTREVLFYGAVCAALMNIPFALSLAIARHVPAAEYAMIISTAPLVNFLVAWALGGEAASPRRLLAVAVGFLSSAVLIVSREGMLTGDVSWWTIATFSVPVMYTAYNRYAARHWPRNGDILAIGATESVMSALLCLPFLIVLDPPWSAAAPGLAAYTFVGLITFMWILERLAFFTLIRDKGSLYTIQAVYVSAPASVIFSFLIFGGSGDIWLWICLCLLMLALWLNNSGRPVAQAA